MDSETDQACEVHSTQNLPRKMTIQDQVKTLSNGRSGLLSIATQNKSDLLFGEICLLRMELDNALWINVRGYSW
jgi:hypothetical protein